MKILFVNSSITYGGASKVIVWLSNIFLEKHYEVAIYTISGCYRTDIAKNVKLFRCKSNVNKNNFLWRNSCGLFIHALNLRKHLKEWNYDLIINFADHSIYPLTIANIGLNYKVLLSERMDPYSASFSDRIRQFLYRFADFYVFQTDDAKRFFGRKIQKKSKVIYNPVIEKKTGKWELQYTDNIIISVARLHVLQKRQDLLLSAFSKFHEKMPDYKLWLVGDGADEDRLRQMTKSLSIEDSVVFCGYQADIFSFLRKAKLFVLSSDFEGIPNSIIEALQFGIPIIATDCSPGGARLLLDNGKHGKLIKRGSAEHLYNAMLESINDDVLLKMSLMTDGALERFAENKISEEWVSWINQNVKLKDEDTSCYLRY